MEPQLGQQTCLTRFGNQLRPEKKKKALPKNDKITITFTSIKTKQKRQIPPLKLENISWPPNIVT